MIKKSMQNLTNILIKKEICRAQDKDIIIHGLTSGIELIFNILTTILLGLIFGLFIESMFFLISFSLIRMYAGGYHCKKAISCYIMSSATIILVLGIVKYTPIQNMNIISLVFLFIAIPILLKFAPVGIATKPLDEKSRKYFRKKMILHLYLELILLSILFILNLNALGYIICISIFISCLLVVLNLILS